jgi:CDP-ribitol ribitolphosphotransferase
MEKIFSIENIEWERTFLRIEVCLPSNAELFLKRGSEIIRFGRRRTASLFEANIATAQGRNFLDNGDYIIGTLDGEKFTPLPANPSLVKRLKSCCGIFRYTESKLSYTIDFVPFVNESGGISVKLESYFMRVNPKPKSASAKRETVSAKSFLRRFARYTFMRLIALFYLMVSPFFSSESRSRRILLMSDTRGEMEGNLAALNDRMIARGFDRKYVIDYSFRVAGCDWNLFRWMSVIIKIARAGHIFVDDHAPQFAFIPLRKGTEYVQVWHAGVGFKSAGYARFGLDSSPHPYVNWYKKLTKAIAPSSENVRVYAEVFGIPEEDVIPVGLPRTDAAADAAEFYDKYPEAAGKKIILYAPTYRGSGQRSAHFDYSVLDLKKIYDFCGDEYVFLIKPHPYVTGHADIEPYAPRIFEAPANFSAEKLLSAADILITDYSSIYYEFTAHKKPVVFFLFDLPTYSAERGLHRDIAIEAPGKIVYNFDELMDALRSKDFEIDKTLAFARKTSKIFDGAAAERLIDAVFTNL